jgi:hypothetical protein
MNERHSIWLKRHVLEEEKPWTEDLILRTYKFTNVFRQLDKGTVVLTEILRGQSDLNLIFFNIAWYRLFNYYVHANELGFVEHYRQVEEYILNLAKHDKRIFTSAWMTTGVMREDKHITYLRATKEAWDNRAKFTELILGCLSLEKACQILTELYMVGKFMAYELACDMRFTPLLDKATDVCTWTNMGPGAQRGLRRLGYPHKNQSEGCCSMVGLYSKIVDGDCRSLISDCIVMNSDEANMERDRAPWPFELREIEHNLCEMDKYMRVKTGEGTPRSKYPGV